MTIFEEVTDDTPPPHPEQNEWVTIPTTKQLKGQKQDLSVFLQNTCVKPKSNKNNEQNMADTTSKRSRVCRSIQSNSACKYGDKCNFAHNFEELSPKICMFGDRCRNVKYTKSGSFSNIDNKGCQFIHNGETKRNYCIRMGYKKMIKNTISNPVINFKIPVDTNKNTKSVVVKSESIHILTPHVWSNVVKGNVPEYQVQNNNKKPVIDVVTPIVKPKDITPVKKPVIDVKKTILFSPVLGKRKCDTLSDIITHKRVRKNNPTKTQKINEKKKDDKVIILKVPRSFVKQALATALKCGKTNIKIELTD
jgi:hypothetical protein